MNVFKKLLSVVCALALALGIAVPALAEGAGSITIADPAIGTTYKAYKIFDATSTDGNIAYTMASDSAWKDVLVDANGSKFEGLEFVLSGNTYTVIKTTGFNAADFAAYLKENTPETATAFDFTDGTAANLDNGYYLVTGTKGNVTNAKSSLATVLGDAVTVQDKQDMPFDKTVDEVKEKGVQVGDVLRFKITSEVPSDVDEAAPDTYVFQVSDKMDAGLTFDKDSFTAKIGGTEVSLTEITNVSTQLTGNQVRFDADGRTFELSLEMSGKTAGAAIEITYNATVNNDAVATVSENNAVLQYGNDPTHLTTKDSQTKVYTSQLVIDKFETGAPEQKLEGAKFVLAKQVDGANKYYKVDADGKVTWVDSQDGATVVTTDTNGRADFNGLLDGKYALIETAAPDGYTKIDHEIPVTIDGSAATSVGLTATQVKLALVTTANINNTPGSLLPSTGGMGTTLMYAAGIVGLAAYLFIRHNRKSSEK